MTIDEEGLNRSLGIRSTGERGELVLESTEKHTSVHGFVHMAVLEALAEGAAWTLMGENAIVSSITSHFLKPAKPGEQLRTRVEVVQKGRSLGLARADVFQGSEHISTSSVSFFFMKSSA